MAYPVKVCSICSEEFELKPDKPGFANRCPACSAADADEPVAKGDNKAADGKTNSEMNAARRQAMRDLLYRKEG